MPQGPYTFNELAGFRHHSHKLASLDDVPEHDSRWFCGRACYQLFIAMFDPNLLFNANLVTATDVSVALWAKATFYVIFCAYLEYE